MDDVVDQILTGYDTITVVGASRSPSKAAHTVPALWLQLGIVSAEARAIAESAGLLYVEDRCLAIEQRRLAIDAPR